MLHIVLVEPEIPQNCGNIARTCAATGSVLHLVKPLGFDISEKAVKRAGLDYWHLVDVRVHENLPDLFAQHPEAADNLWLATTKAPRPPLPATAGCSSARRLRGCRPGFGSSTASAVSVCPCAPRPGA